MPRANNKRPVKVTYSSNNSGGNWWLDDDDWAKLEAAGWKVEWVAKRHKKERFMADKGGKRFLGALATTAYKFFSSPVEAIQEWERVLGKRASSEGCGCCGPPHSFSWEGPGEESGWASGSDCASYLYPDAGVSEFRDALEEISRLKSELSRAKDKKINRKPRRSQSKKA